MWQIRPLPRLLAPALRAQLELLVLCLLSLLPPLGLACLPTPSTSLSAPPVSSAPVSSFPGLVPPAPPPSSFAPLPSLYPVAPALPPAVVPVALLPSSSLPSFAPSLFPVAPPVHPLLPSPATGPHLPFASSVAPSSFSSFSVASLLSSDPPAPSSFYPAVPLSSGDSSLPPSGLVSASSVFCSGSLAPALSWFLPSLIPSAPSSAPAVLAPVSSLVPPGLLMGYPFPSSSSSWHFCPFLFPCDSCVASFFLHPSGSVSFS